MGLAIMERRALFGRDLADLSVLLPPGLGYFLPGAIIVAGLPGAIGVAWLPGVVGASERAGRHGPLLVKVMAHHVVEEAFQGNAVIRVFELVRRPVHSEEPSKALPWDAMRGGTEESPRKLPIANVPKVVQGPDMQVMASVSKVALPGVHPGPANRQLLYSPGI
jgi:hypothetical protein